jgi:hypothetical protein
MVKGNDSSTRCGHHGMTHSHRCGTSSNAMLELYILVHVFYTYGQAHDLEGHEADDTLPPSSEAALSGTRHQQPLIMMRRDQRMNTIERNTTALSAAQREAILGVLKDRFENNMHRHEGLAWADVQARLDAHPDKLWSLHAMERTGGEPDVIGHDPATDEFIFYDCVAESPRGRRSVCYDRDALDSRKEHKPADSALDMAAAMGIELLTEAQYRELQQLGQFDTKTSSWVQTPADIRKLGGALFCARRYGQVFVYHNGAESYYAARGFRGALRV